MIVRRRNVTQEPPFGPGFIGDWTKIGEASMLISKPQNGLFTTTDQAQADAIAGGVTDGYGDAMWGDGTGALPPRPAIIDGAPAYERGNQWAATGGGFHFPTLYRVNDTAQVAGYVGAGGIDITGATGINGNYPGDTLVVYNTGPWFTDQNPPGYAFSGWAVSNSAWLEGPGWVSDIPNTNQDTYIWDGSAWKLVQRYVGPAQVLSGWFSANQGFPENWDIHRPGRPEPAHPNLYAYTWTSPGTFADGVKFRCTLKLAPAIAAPPGVLGSNEASVGLVMNMTDLDHGLMWVPWGARGRGSGWTKKPSDLRGWSGHYLPERVQGDGSYCLGGEQPLGGTFYGDLASGQTESGAEFADIHGGGWGLGLATYATDPGADGNIAIEVWRQSNRAYAAFYRDSFSGASPVATVEFAEDLSGGPYADGVAGHFGLVFNYLNAYSGLVDVRAVPV